MFIRRGPWSHLLPLNLALDRWFGDATRLVLDMALLTKPFDPV